MKKNTTKSISHICQSGFDNKALEFASQLINISINENRKIFIAISDVAESHSKAIIEILKDNSGKIKIENLTILLKQAINIEIDANVQICSAIQKPFPVSLLMIVGTENYILIRSNEVSGYVGNSETTKEARLICKNIFDIYASADSEI